MSKYRNRRKQKFLSALSELPSLEDLNNDLTKRCKFNFSYFDPSQEAGQKFKEWTHKQLYDLLGKIKEYTTKPLDYWKQERVGSGGLKILEIYGGFPPKSKFIHPKYVPHQAQWGRFRLGSKIRLVGFTIPTDLHNTPHKKTGEFFDKNTFYVVFFDRDHMFYLTEKK
jgi:hypothetical protein